MYVVSFCLFVFFFLYAVFESKTLEKFVGSCLSRFSTGCRLQAFAAHLAGQFAPRGFVVDEYCKWETCKRHVVNMVVEVDRFKKSTVPSATTGPRRSPASWTPQKRIMCSSSALQPGILQPGYGSVLFWGHPCWVSGSKRYPQSPYTLSPTNSKYSFFHWSAIIYAFFGTCPSYRTCPSPLLRLLIAELFLIVPCCFSWDTVP